MPIKASDFTTLKAKIKAECLRRNQTGSVASYGTDYTDTPTAGRTIKTTHITEILNPIKAIDGVTRTTPTRVGDLSALTTVVTALEGKSMTATTLANTGCAASCTGLCLGGCTNTCTGTCSTACAAGCGNDCTGGCSNGCAGTCTGGCGSTCQRGCALYCETNCTGLCGTSCGDACSTGCGDECTDNCERSCWDACWNRCADGSGAIQGG